MSRIKETAAAVEEILMCMQDVKKRDAALAHLQGVSLAAVLVSCRRGADPELPAIAGLLHDIHAYVSGSYNDHAHLGAVMAEEILQQLHLTTAEETKTICSMIYHHDDKDVIDGEMEEILKDADVIHHCFQDPYKPVKEKERERYERLLQEFSLQMKPMKADS